MEEQTLTVDEFPRKEEETMNKTLMNGLVAFAMVLGMTGLAQAKQMGCTCQLLSDADKSLVGTWQGNVKKSMLGRLATEKKNANSACESATAQHSVDCKKCSCGDVIAKPYGTRIKSVEAAKAKAAEDAKAAKLAADQKAAAEASKAAAEAKAAAAKADAEKAKADAEKAKADADKAKLDAEAKAKAEAEAKAKAEAEAKAKAEAKPAAAEAPAAEEKK